VTHARLELTAVFVTSLAHFLLALWLDLQLVFIVLACFFWVGFVAWRTRSDPQALARWGFAAAGFRRSLGPLVPALILALASFIAIGLGTGRLLLHWHLVLVGLLYPAWGLVQQFLVVALVAGNLRRHTRIPEWGLVLMTALAFAAVHAPSWPLSLAAFCLALITVTVYFRTRNLWALGLFHGWFATGLYFFALGSNPWLDVVATRLWP